ncbi:hypothetical protein SNEBB_006216 [Seison nebaliae]|nr:hypothetical protein SNEBB_006216 [Seison nebaliae]
MLQSDIECGVSSKIKHFFKKVNPLRFFRRKLSGKSKIHSKKLDKEKELEMMKQIQETIANSQQMHLRKLLMLPIEDILDLPKKFTTNHVLNSISNLIKTLEITQSMHSFPQIKELRNRIIEEQENLLIRAKFNENTESPINAKEVLIYQSDVPMK